MAIALVPIDGHGLAADQRRQGALGFGPEGLFAFRGVDAGEAHPMRALARIEDLDGIAVEDADDLADEGVGMGWRGDREGQDKEGREQTQERKGHDVPRRRHTGIARLCCDQNQ